MDRLDAAAIALPGVEVRIMQRCSSTNTLLLEDAGGGRVLLAAEAQSAGRGRRGRRWHSAPGTGLTFSLAHRVQRPLRELAGLSLVAGVAVSRALRGLGVARAALKWPNDIVVDGAKVGGILVETRSHNGSIRTVIGVGINCRRDSALALRLGRKIGFLDQYMRVERNLILQTIAQSLLDALGTFERHGLEPLRREWEAMDAHAGQKLRVRLAGGRTVSGIASGLAGDGSLRLTTRQGVRAVSSGRVISTRPLRSQPA